MNELIARALLIIGTLFMFVAGLGVLRMPDLYTRMSASTKASTLGVAFIMLGVLVHFGEATITTRALAIVLFLLLTAPVAAHLIGRAGYLSGAKLWEGTIVDELQGRYDIEKHELSSSPIPPEDDQVPPAK